MKVSRIKKYGTLLYRTNSDILATLAASLHKLSKSSHDEYASHFGTQNLRLATPSNSQLVVDDLNPLIHQQIRKFLVPDTREILESRTVLTSWKLTGLYQRWTLHYGQQSLHLQDLFQNVGVPPG